MIKTLALFAFNEPVKLQKSAVTADSGKQDVAEGGEMWNSDGDMVTSQKEKFEQLLELKLEDVEGESNTLSEVFVSKLPKDMVVKISRMALRQWKLSGCSACHVCIVLRGFWEQCLGIFAMSLQTGKASLFRSH